MITILVALTERLLLEHSIGVSVEFLKLAQLCPVDSSSNYVSFSSYYGVLLYCLTEKSHSVRKCAANVVKRQLGLLEGPKISLELMDQLLGLLTAAEVL